LAALLIAGGSTSSTFRWDARQLWNCAQGAEPARRSFAGFSEAIILHPSVAETWNYRDTTLQHRDALAAYDRAIALKPYLTEPWLVLSLVLSLLGES
jgi:hypothetical protein